MVNIPEPGCAEGLVPVVATRANSETSARALGYQKYVVLFIG